MIYYITEEKIQYNYPDISEYREKGKYGHTLHHKNHKDTIAKKNIDTYASKENYDAMKKYDEDAIKMASMSTNFNKLRKYITDNYSDYTYKFTVINVFATRIREFIFILYGNNYKYSVKGNWNGEITNRHFDKMSEDEKESAYNTITKQQFKKLLKKSIETLIKELKISDNELKFIIRRYRSIDYHYFRKGAFTIIEYNGSTYNPDDPNADEDGYTYHSIKWISEFAKKLEVILKDQCDNVSSVKVDGGEYYGRVYLVLNKDFED